MTAIRILATTLGLMASTTAAFADDPLPRAKPEDVGLSSERLARIGSVLKADIEARRIPGAVIAIARHGKRVALDAYGWRDKAAGVAMITDTIFDIASMTKLMTTVGALMRPHHRIHCRADARAISAGQSVHAARHDRHGVFHLAR